MEEFYNTEVDRLIVLLGYSAEPVLIRSWIDRDFEGAVVSIVRQRLETLEKIDGLLLAELGKPVISEVDGIALAPGGKIRSIRAEGSRILNEIAAMLGVRILYNKYGMNNLSIRSY